MVFCILKIFDFFLNSNLRLNYRGNSSKISIFNYDLINLYLRLFIKYY